MASVFRIYKDVNGKQRMLKFHSKVDGLVPLYKPQFGPSHSTATRWEDETGFITQIPDQVWNTIKYEDYYESDK